MKRGFTMTLNQAANRIWEERWQFNKDGKKSLQTFRNTFRYLGGGDREIHTLTAEDMMHLRMMLRKTKAPATVNRHLAAVKTVLKQSFRIWKAIDDVPYIQMEKEKGRRDRIVSYDEEERILGWLMDERTCSYDIRSYDSIRNKRTFYNFFVLLMDTGARPGELLRLRPHDFSRNTRKLHIAPGKTDEYRYVWLTDRAAECFQTQAKQKGSGVLFSFRIEVVSRYFNHIKNQLLINDPSLTPYCYRHTCATRMVEANVNPMVIQKQLGHRTLITTQRYTKADVRQLEAGMTAVDIIRRNNTISEPMDDPENEET
ncbi:MAG: site-specific integrase [Desulfobacterales bacterium]|nr:site-specific integrase [Desulfobacterales bacterium]